GCKRGRYVVSAADHAYLSDAVHVRNSRCLEGCPATEGVLRLVGAALRGFDRVFHSRGCTAAMIRRTWSGGSGIRGYSTSVPQPFESTRWSLVVAAKGRDEAEARRALAELCQLYWFPLYGYVRRRGHSHEAAQDLTQEFFARLLEKGGFGQPDPAKGR